MWGVWGGNSGKVRKRQAGQAMVEFAIGAIVFLVIIFGVLDFGRAVFDYNMLANSAREGARWAIIQGNTNTDVINHVVATSDGILSGNDVTISGSRSCSAVPCPSVTVTVTYSFTPVTPLIGSLVGSITMTASSTMVVEI